MTTRTYVPVPKKAYTIRLPEPLADLVEASARRDNCSQTGWIEQAVRARIEQEAAGGTDPMAQQPPRR